MKTLRNLTLGLCAFLFGIVSIFAQQDTSNLAADKRIAKFKIDKNNVKVQRHTIMSRFEPELASSEEERMMKKQNRIAETEKKLNIIDTLDISKRKRRILFRDLKYTPYSTRLKKAVLVDTKLEDDAKNQ